METLSALIQKLRKNKIPDRRQAALELAVYAQNGEPEALAELIRMARAERRTLLSAYTLPDQLAAIEALARTGRREALDFLKSLKARREFYTESCTGLACGADREPQWSAIAYEFPNAKGELGHSMTYMGKRFHLTQSVPELTKQEHEAIMAENPCHKLIDAAIAQLEKEL
jgi:hypothetical protein